MSDEKEDSEEQASDVADPTVGIDATCSNEDDITLVFDSSGQIRPIANQISDYQNRGALLGSMSVWEFVACVEKVSKVASKRKHKGSVDAEEDEEDIDLDSNKETMEDFAVEVSPDAATDDVDPLEDDDPYDGDVLGYAGRKRPRVELKAPHIEEASHVLRVCTIESRKIPVPIGPAMPRRDVDEMKQKHARLMLILFKPWRHAQDLRNSGESWEDAYSRFQTDCSSAVLEAIDNIQILHECKVSRDAPFANRQNRKRAGVNRVIVRKGAANEAMYADEGEGLVLDHLEHIAQARSNHIASTAAHISDSIMAADISSMFSPDTATLDENTSNDLTSEGWAGSHTLVDDAHPIPEYDWNKSYQARKDQWKPKVSTPSVLEAPSRPENSAGASSVSDGSAFRTPVNNSNVYQEVLGVHSADSLTATQNNVLLPATVDEVIAEYTLNTE
jgi:hypothetical protein